MRILVTGAAGYLGSVLVPELLTAGHRVLALDNFMYEQQSLLDCCANPQLEIVRGDVRDYGLVEHCLRDVDMIFPLACITGMPACKADPVAARTINRDAIVALLRLRDTAQGVIYPTTNSGYGIGSKEKYCDETSPLHPVSEYAKGKAETEAKVLAAPNTLAFRFATLFGASPRMRLDLLVNDFVYRAVAEKSLVVFESHFHRNFLHVRDAARAFLHGLARFEDMKGQVYNVGLSDSNLTKWQLCEQIRQQLREFYFTDYELGEDEDRRDYIVSNAKMEATGFRPQYSLQAGIAELIKVSRVLRRLRYGNV